MEKKDYCPGMDCLKILSMLMIVCLHILGIGGVDDACTENTAAYVVTWLLEIPCLCSVNCYGMVSGYLSYRAKPARLRVHKFLYLWAEVVFYGMLMTMITGLVSDQATITHVEIMGAALPVCFSQYWYFNAFVCVYFLSPWLNKMLSQTEPKEDHLLLGVLFGLFSVYGTVTTFWNRDIFWLEGGYSVIWLIILYLFGAYLRKYADELKRIKSGYLIAAFLLTNGLMFAYKMMKNTALVKKLGANMFLIYTSPLMVCSAACLVLLFHRMTVKSERTRKILMWFASSTFAVYLIHVQSVFFANLFRGRFSWIAEQNWMLIPILALLCCIGIFTVCILLDKGRQWLFRLVGLQKLLGVGSHSK